MQRLSVFPLLLCLTAGSLLAADWPAWRGVNDDGLSPDLNLPAEWSPSGENMLWKAPLGGRSTPIVIQGKVCVIRLSDPEDEKKWQEQVVCVDEKTGKQLWEHRQNVFQTDIPHHRVGWASLVEPYRCRTFSTAVKETHLVRFKAAQLRALCEADYAFGRQLLTQVARLLSSRLKSARVQLAAI